jgi:CheY-like chemotaxis protein
MNGLAILAVDDEPRALAGRQAPPRDLRLRRPRRHRDERQGGLVSPLGGPYDALFLDVADARDRGMALARLLRRFADPPAVVFLTGHPDAAVEAFEVQALDFLIKPVTP